MEWIKKGLLIDPSKYNYPWMATHVQNPFVEHLEGDFYNLHFAGRDERGYAHGGECLIEVVEEEIITEGINPNPTITPGPLGAFDDCGAMPSCIVSYKDTACMYYTGWSQHVRTPFTFFIGAAFNNHKWHKLSLAPVLGRDPCSPYLAASPWVIIEGNLWRMWFVKGVKWKSFDKHYYNIGYAESNNGTEWIVDAEPAIDFKDENEYAIGRPVVWLSEAGEYEMIFSYRGDIYRPGYARSRDGIKWIREDYKIDLPRGKEGEWDSDMICYPFIFEHESIKYMLYNGNSYGRTGCGYAVLEK